jgi:hypothetical protein
VGEVLDPAIALIGMILEEVVPEEVVLVVVEGAVGRVENRSTIRIGMDIGLIDDWEAVVVDESTTVDGDFWIVVEFGFEADPPPIGREGRDSSSSLAAVFIGSIDKILSRSFPLTYPKAPISCAKRCCVALQREERSNSPCRAPTISPISFLPVARLNNALTFF